MARNKGKNNQNNNNKNKQALAVRLRKPNQSTRPSGPSVLQPPTLTSAFNAGRQSEIALPVRKGLSVLTIHPDNTRWLGEAAPSFQRWGMKDMTLWYEPRVATSTSGQIALTFLSDFADLYPSSLEETVCLSGAQRGSPWSRFQLPKQRNRLFDYCSLKDFAAGDTTTKGDRSPGRVVVWADMDSSFPSTDVVGWVYISYTPILQQPILRRLQLGGNVTAPVPDTGSGGGGSGGNDNGGVIVQPPVVDGPSPYLYHEQDHNSRFDFLGYNTELDPNHITGVTQNIAYSYFADKGYCCLFNMSSIPVHFFMSAIFRDFGWLTERKFITFKMEGASLVEETNKGMYWTRDHNDGAFRVSCVIQPGGRIWFETTWTTGWKRSELYALELGKEHGLSDIDFKWESKALAETSFDVDLSLVDDVSTATVPANPTFAKKLGASSRNLNYVGLQGYADGSRSLMSGVTIFYNGASAHTAFGGASAANRMGFVLRNDSGATKVFYINILTSQWAASYATTQLTPVVFGIGNVNFTTTSDYAHVSCVTLSAGSAVGWSMALRSSAFNGGSAVESVGDVFLSLQLGDSYFPQA